MIQPNKDLRRRFEVLLAGPVSSAVPGGQQAVWAAWSRQDFYKMLRWLWSLRSG